MACEKTINLNAKEAVITVSPATDCPACAAKRVHTPEEWKLHPMAGHGCYDGKWSHPDLIAEAEAKKATKGAKT
jgi:hypothetical protein